MTNDMGYNEALIFSILMLYIIWTLWLLIYVK